MSDALNISATAPYSLDLAVSEAEEGEASEQTAPAKADGGLKAFAARLSAFTQRLVDGVTLATFVAASSVYLAVVAVLGPAVLLAFGVFNAAFGVRPAPALAPVRDRRDYHGRGRWRPVRGG